MALFFQFFYTLLSYNGGFCKKAFGQKIPKIAILAHLHLLSFGTMTSPSPTFLKNGDVIYGRPHRSEDSISTKSSHHTNVMLRKHSEGRHSERSRQEHSSNRKRSVRLIFNYLEMYSTYLAFWYNYVHFRQIGQLPVRANCAPKMYILPKKPRQMTTINES